MSHTHHPSASRHLLSRCAAQRAGNAAATCRNALLLGLLCQVALAAPVTVHVKSADGRWVKVQGQEQGGRVTVSLGPGQLGCGATTVIVNKPAWMQLDDAEAPKLTWVKLHGVDVKAEGGDLGVVSRFPAVLTVGVKDNANPLDPRSSRAVLSPISVSPTPTTTELGPPKPSGRLTVEIPQLPPGGYELAVSVPDLSPQANALHLTFRFSVMGFDISEDRQTIRIGGPGGEFTFRAKRLGELQVGDATPAYLSTGIAGQYMYIEKIERVEVLQDTRQLKSIRVHALVGETDQKQDGTQLARLEYELTVRDDLPALLVTSRTILLAAAQEVYTWWGWLPGTAWWDLAGEHAWTGQYADVGKVGWVYLPQRDAHTPGIGWISPLFFGESRFSNMLLHTDPRQVPTEANAGVEMPFAIMPATSAEQVATTAEKIKALGLW